MADKQESKVTCCGIEFRDSETWVDHLLSKADHYDPLFPEGRKCPVDRPAPSAEADHVQMSIKAFSQIIEEISQLRKITEAFVKLGPAICHMWRGIAMPEYHGRTFNEWINEAERALSSTATEKTEAE